MTTARPTKKAPILPRNAQPLALYQQSVHARLQGPQAEAESL